MILICILIYLLFNLADSFGDVAIEKGKQKEWHFWGAILAGLMFAVLSYAVYGFAWEALILFVILTLVRFPVFNLMHNLRKGDKWNYLSDHGIDGFVKRLINKL